MQQPNPELGQIDLAAIAHRVRKMLANLGISGTAFCETTGIAYSTFRTYMSGSRAPSAEFFAAAYRSYGVAATWLLTGEGSMSGTANATDTRDFVTIPVLAVQVAAGPGAVNSPETESPASGMCISRGWLARRNLNPRNLRVVEVRGASMAGVLSHGDQVLLDQSDCNPRSGFVYVLRVGEELLVKYLELRPGGVLRVGSANPSFEPYDVDLSKTPDVAVVGRVVASMHDW